MTPDRPVTGYPQAGDNAGDNVVPFGYRQPVAASAAGVTYRQLDYWCRTDLVVPSVRAATGSGTQRLYGRDDIVRLALVRHLLDAGFSLPTIRARLGQVLSRDVVVGSRTDTGAVAVSYSVAAGPIRDEVDRRLRYAARQSVDVGRAFDAAMLAAFPGGPDPTLDDPLLDCCAAPLPGPHADDCPEATP